MGAGEGLSCTAAELISNWLLRPGGCTAVGTAREQSSATLQMEVEFLLAKQNVSGSVTQRRLLAANLRRRCHVRFLNDGGCSRAPHAITRTKAPSGKWRCKFLSIITKDLRLLHSAANCAQHGVLNATCETPSLIFSLPAMALLSTRRLLPLVFLCY